MSLASSLAAQPKQTLSFDEALNLMLTNNPSIKASTYEQEAAERERKAAYGLRLPKIGVTGAYAYLSEDINIDLNGMKEPVGGLIGGMGGVLPPPVLQQAQALMKQNWALPLQDRSLGTVGGHRITVPVYTGGKTTLQTMRQRSKSAKRSRKGIKPATRSSQS